MKKLMLRNLVIPIVFVCSFLISTNIQSQPWPDENFCSVQANLILNDSVCIVGGSASTSLYYEDGEFDNFFAWLEPSGMVAVKFSPGFYPANLLGGQINVGDGSYPIGSDFLGTDFRIVIYDDDGPENMPGTFLDSITVTVENFGWVKFGGLDVTIQNGDFYLGMEQLNSPPNVAPVAIDTDLPVVNKSYTKQVNNEWKLSTYQDFMIRALYCHSESSNKGVFSENYPWYEIARISDFNPENGEGPENGTSAILDSLNYFYFQDTTFYSLSLGYYAYAVKVYSENGDTTGWYFTNTVQRQLVGFEEYNIGKSEIQVYPNPANNELKIKADETIQSVCLVNLMGEIVYYEKFKQNEISINISFLLEGFYVAKIETKSGVTNQKILLKK